MSSPMFVNYGGIKRKGLVENRYLFYNTDKSQEEQSIRGGRQR